MIKTPFVKDGTRWPEKWYEMRTRTNKAKNGTSRPWQDVLGRDCFGAKSPGTVMNDCHFVVWPVNCILVLKYSRSVWQFLSLVKWSNYAWYFRIFLPDERKFTRSNMFCEDWVLSSLMLYKGLKGAASSIPTNDLVPSGAEDSVAKFTSRVKARDYFPWSKVLVNDCLLDVSPVTILVLILNMLVPHPTHPN